MKLQIHPLDEMTCACLPRDALPRLAPLRCEPGVQIAQHDAHCWIRWHSANDLVARVLFAIPGCKFFAEREGRWYPLRRTLPFFDMPVSLDYRPLSDVLFPEAIVPIAPPTGPMERMPLTLVADRTYRPARAAECKASDVAGWAQQIPPCALERIQAARHGDRLFLLGKKLPWFAGSERFWGGRVLSPIGFRPEPQLTDAEYLAAAGAKEDDVLVLRRGREAGCRCECIEENLFAPLSHATLRMP